MPALTLRISKRIIFLFSRFYRKFCLFSCGLIGLFLAFFLTRTCLHFFCSVHKSFFFFFAFFPVTNALLFTSFLILLLFVFRYGETPMHFACRFGRRDIVELLLSRGADMNIRGKYGTPYDVAWYVWSGGNFSG